MKIIAILKKHYLATILLVLSLSLVGYAVWERQSQQNLPVPVTQIENNSEPKKSDPTANPDNKKPNPNGELRIPEIIKPTSTKPKEVESASSLNNQTENQHDIGTPVETDFLRASMVINGKSYPIALIGSSSVYDVMQSFNEVGKIKVDFKDYSGLGYFVDGIDGVKSDTFRAKYWIYYINGAKAQIGISNYILKQNDIITWKYERAE